MITPVQCRAGRALIGWSQADLARRSGVSRATIADFEVGRRVSLRGTIHQIEATLRRGGVVFTTGADSLGVQIRTADIHRRTGASPGS